MEEICMIKRILLAVIVSYSLVNVTNAGEIPSGSQLIPIINGCEELALEFIKPLKKSGLINFTYKKDIYTPEFIPKFSGYLEIIETDAAKGKNLPAAIGYNIYSRCKPTVPHHFSLGPGKINQMSRVLHNAFNGGKKESYIIVNQDKIRLFIVDKDSKEK